MWRIYLLIRSHFLKKQNGCGDYVNFFSFDPIPDFIDFIINGKQVRLRLVENATEVEMADDEIDDTSIDFVSVPDEAEVSNSILLRDVAQVSNKSVSNSKEQVFFSGSKQLQVLVCGNNLDGEWTSEKGSIEPKPISTYMNFIQKIMWNIPFMFPVF